MLMLDDANMAFGDFHYAQEALLRFVDEGMENGDMAAVVRASVGSGTSQLFTFDRQWLYRTLERMVWRPPLAICHVFSPLLSVLTGTIRALADFPGRKSILLISPGVPRKQLVSRAHDRGLGQPFFCHHRDHRRARPPNPGRIRRWPDLVHGFPGTVGVVTGYRQRWLAKNRGNVLLIDYAVLIHNECVDTGHSIFGRPCY